MFDRTLLGTDEFSWKKSLAMAMASLLAYQKNADGLVHVATQTWGFQECKPFGVGETQGFVAWDEKIVLVSFRGTESVGDWLSNLDLLQYGAKLREGAPRVLTGLRDRTADGDWLFEGCSCRR